MRFPAVTEDSPEAPAETGPREPRPVGGDGLALAAALGLALAARLVFLHIAPNGSTDAGSRYRGALAWMSHPLSLPHATATDAWLPLHFWLLGGWMLLWKSETGARLLSVLLGSLTLLPYWGIVKRAFDRRVAMLSTVFLAVFGFHIAFSVTTGSEAPTVFLLAAGTYGWMRYRGGEGSRWMALAAIPLSAASLIRFESWLFAPMLGLATLDYSAGWRSLVHNRVAWRRACTFTAFASAGAAGWLIFSFLKWGDPLELPHRTIALRLGFEPAVLRHALLYRVLSVPGSLVVSLSPLVAALAVWGLLSATVSGSREARALAALVLVVVAFSCSNALRYDITQARYTVLFSWLLIPFAGDALRRLGARWNGPGARNAAAWVLASFLIWQGAVIAGSECAPSFIADHLAAISPTLPLHGDMRDLTAWLRERVPPKQPVVIDDFNWESDTLVKYSGLDASRDFLVTPAYYASPPLLTQALRKFVSDHRPALMICSPYGPIGRRWPVGDKPSLNVPALGIQLQREWRGKYWSVYAVTYGF